tara:strand:- start:167 stop:1444 length:1278 start_codon:yes stop_codon:yes gene_type:complete
MGLRNHQFITSLTPKSKTYKKGLGDGLFVVVDKVYDGVDGTKNGGRKYFKGRIKGEEVWVGVFGNKAGELSLADARNKFYQIKDTCLKQNISYKELQRQNERAKLATWCLDDAIKSFLEYKKELIKETTFIEYERKLNQVLTHIDGSTPLEELEWDKGGRETIEEVISKLEDGRNGHNYDLARRSRNLLNQVFKRAISKGKMTRGQNPASLENGEPRKHKVNHHPHLKWEEVPEFLEKVSLNPVHNHPFSQLATKFMLLTFLRAGALTRLKWEMIDEEKELLIIDGSTSGLKRTKGRNDDRPHYIPITSHMKELLDYAKRFNTGQEYIFLPMRESRFPHLDPSAPNHYIRNLGYKGKLRAHGWRSVAITYGVDLLREDLAVIKKQAGHLPDNKVDQAYDKSEMLDRRREFLEKWGNLLVENGLEL